MANQEVSSLLETVQNDELADEIEAINAIYGPDTATVTSTSGGGNGNGTTTSSSILDLGSSGSPNTSVTTAVIQVPNHPYLSFVVGFDSTYPETPPRIVGTASTSSRGEGKTVVDVLDDIVGRIHHPGLVCLFEVISEAAEVFEELNIGGNNNNNNIIKTEEEESNPVGLTKQNEEATVTSKPTRPEYYSDDSTTGQLNFATLSLRETFGLDAPPNWVLSEVVAEKKSVFVGRAAHVTNPEQAQAFIDYLLSTEKKVAAATHNISAWRIRQKKQPATSPDSGGGGAGGESVFQDCDDDGETAAGGRLLHLMQLMDVWNVVLVVTRWYGGVKLGPDRFRIINAVGRDALVKGGFHQDESTTNSSSSNRNNEKGKKKGKK